MATKITQIDNKMEFGMRIAGHSILKEINNGCQKNLAFSPLSLHMSLNLLTNGARGSTLEQLLRFLDSESIAQLNAQSSLVMELATSGSQSGGHGPTLFNGTLNGCSRPYPSFRNLGSNEPAISLVNGIWVDKQFPLKHSFKQLAGDVYKANSQSLDFNQAGEVVREINSWAREASKGRIDKLVSAHFLKDSILVLASALHFKGSWDERFRARDTEDGDFHLLNGDRVRVPFMKKSLSYNFYGSFEGFKVLKMDYKRTQVGKQYAMHIFLPDRNDGLQELTQKFHFDSRFLLENRKLQYVELNRLWLPKLKFDYEMDLASSMKEMGLDLPFGMNAELTEIVDQASDEIVYVSNAIQKSYVEIHEKGTAATSVSAYEYDCGMAPPEFEEPPKIDFVADHPFLFMIKEETSGSVLFVGAALNPLFVN